MHSCPFCGSDKLKVDKKANGYLNTETGKKHKFFLDRADVAQFIYSVRCNSCHARGSTASSESEAVSLWNRRV